MFGAVFSATLLVYNGVSVLALTSVIVTGVFTTLSILLFGARRSKRGVPEFKIVRADESQLTFSKQVDGDMNSIECKFTQMDEQFRVSGSV